MTGLKLFNDGKKKETGVNIEGIGDDSEIIEEDV